MKNLSNNIIDYNLIKQSFNPQEWDISYLTYNEMSEVLNFPIKMGLNLIDRQVHGDLNIDKNFIFLIIVKNSIDYDYSINDEAFSLINTIYPNLKIEYFSCNLKYAAVKAGLGQYAKNSLFYHPKFEFNTHLTTILVHSQIINLSNRNEANFNLLALCNNCTDCIKACPVSAIHYRNNLTWVDMYKCDNFCSFGNHPKIPSIKWNQMKIQFNISDIDTIKNIHNFQDFFKKYPTFNKTSKFIDNNQQQHWIQYPVCRECSSQHCTKYKGVYPYDKDRVIIK